MPTQSVGKATDTPGSQSRVQRTASEPAAATRATVAAKSGTLERAPIDEALADDLSALDRAGLRRSLRRIESAQEPCVRIDGREVLLFCSNNYLGLASHPEVVTAARDACQHWGTGSVSSRLISGHMDVHAELEAKIAAWKGCEAALVFSSGYQANIGVISALAGAGDLVVSDELNHASIIDGCRLSKARISVYRHNDVDDLVRILDEGRDARRILVVTESIFSMDGDRAPLADIVMAAKQRGAWVMVDEAHAAGIFGPRGAGLVAELGLTDGVDVQMGTLGKALASFGAYVAGSERLVEALINRARSFIFTTGLPPSAAAAASAAIDVIEREPERARGLLERAARLGTKLRDAGLSVPSLDSQILPVLVGGTERAVELAGALLERGIYVAAIRPPTVRPGTSRLRVSLMATHTDAQIARLTGALCECAGAATPR